MISTEPLTIEPSPQSAQEFENYLPIHTKILFKHHETSQKVTIKLVNNLETTVSNVREFREAEALDNKTQEESEEELPDLVFKVKLENPEPMGVKISKKNVCLVTIVHSEEEERDAASQRKLITFYLEQQDPSWG